MVWADTVEELILRENKTLEMINELRERGRRDASVRQRDIQNPCNSLSEISNQTFITLSVFTGGTLCNSYAERTSLTLSERVSVITHKRPE